jgi:uncharacterized phiE125 gp8 family phage protein
MKILGDGLVPEAITVPAFKAQVPMAEAPEFDAGLAAILRAATEVVETSTRRPLVARLVEILPPTASGEWTCWWFPVAPVQSVSEVAVWHDDDWLPLAATDWRLLRAHDEPQLVLGEAVRSVYGAADIRVQCTVGHTVVPAGLMQAVILIATEWHAAGAGLGDAVPTINSFAAHALIRQQRYIRPRVMA